ncbi:alanine racemase [Elioraea rosea]|uniref:alanine racemase n=1 Tax=Elioraea rosea TaxID=2492390 RepID=UPI001183781D|nr:alanine racemase [Elioraea rosea]
MPKHGAAVLTIDLDAVAANWLALRARHPSGPVAAVMKADAYGLGAARVAPRLLAEGCRHVFVAHLSEALVLRPIVPEGVLLAVLNGVTEGSEQAFLDHGVVPVLNDPGQVARWSAAAVRAGRRLPALLHVDTGMNRLGLAAAEVRRLAEDPAPLAALDLLYVMTHFVSSEVADDPLNATQAARLAEARAMLPPAPASLANSSGVFLGALGASDLARPGAALYGINPRPGTPNPLTCTVSLDAPVLQVRDTAAGDTVGYNATWRANRPSRIATVAAGYADGYLRSLSGRGIAYSRGRPVPMAGRVSMDLLTFDVTDLPDIAPGMSLRLIGPECPPDSVAERAGTNGYEVLTSLGARYARVYAPVRPLG